MLNSVPRTSFFGLRTRPNPLLILILGLCWATNLWAQSLETRLNGLVADINPKATQVGIAVMEATAQGPVMLYGHNAQTPMTPASNMKILTTATAFATYGSKASFTTTLYQVGEDLLLLGSGDPALGDARLAEAKKESITAAFDAFAVACQQAGIKSFRHLYCDDYVFDQQTTHPDWPKDQMLNWYCAPVGGLNFNANCLDWIPKLNKGRISVEMVPPNTYTQITIKAAPGKSNRVWLWRPAEQNLFELRGTVAQSSTEALSVPIVDPGLWTTTILRDRLVAAGLQQTGQVIRGSLAQMLAAGVKPRQIAAHQTDLMDILTRTNQQSMNMMAEALCKRLGHDASKGQSGTWTNGLTAVQNHLKKLGLPESLYTLADGCGLSANNRVAPEVFARVLCHTVTVPDGNLYIETLARPGADGTLERRFRNAACQEMIFAKTGHIKGVSALSGYLVLPKRTLVFSVLVNGQTGNGNALQEEVCAQIHAWATAGKKN